MLKTRRFKQGGERYLPADNRKEGIMKDNVLMQAAVLEKMEFNLSDFALFLSVMKNKKAHRNILSVILGEQDLQLKDVNVEEVILNKSGKGQYDWMPEL